MEEQQKNVPEGSNEPFIYVNGFMFDPEGKHVILLLKSYPEKYAGKGRMEWQKGRLNGIGGLVQAGEGIEGAMCRKMLEEASIETPIEQWRIFAQTSFNGGVCFHLVAIAKDMQQFESVKAGRDEATSVVALVNLERMPVLYDLKWLLPLAFDKAVKYAELLDINAEAHFIRSYPTKHLKDITAEEIAAGPGSGD